jgi:glycosyltransferase involved in cell wall biosynthesis
MGAHADQPGRQLKIAQITNVDFSLRHFLLPLMRGARARGHEVVGVCADGPLLDLPRAEGFRIEAVPMPRTLSPRANLAALSALMALFERERFDLVHAHMPISGLLSRYAAWRSGVPRIAYTCHGFLFNQPGPWWRRTLARTLETAAGRITGTFLTVSEEEAEDARRLRIHPRATAIGNGRDPAVFRPDPLARAALRAELGAAPGECVVIAVSRLVRHKGYPELLAALREAPDNLVLWVVGERLASDHGDDLAPHFERAAAVLGPRLRLLGYRGDVARLLAAADVFCLPSHFEGLPMSIIEAMLTALPVVSTDIRGPREQVVQGETGLLVPPRDPAALAAALGAMAGDPAGRAAMGAAGLARARALFDERAVVARTLDLLGL